MWKNFRVVTGSAVLSGLLATLAPISARQAPPPTVKEPIRFSAFAISMEAGKAGVVDIAIERWSTDAERAALLDVLAGTSFKMGGQDKLLSALQKIRPRAGYIRSTQMRSWDLQFARENMLPDGSRQVVIATDKPVSFLAAANNTRTMDYPFTFVEMRIKPNAKGEGRLLAMTAVAFKDGRVELENYGQEPVRLTEITEKERKK